MEIFLITLIVIGFLNLVLLFNIGLFLVRFKDRIDLMFKDGLEAMSVIHGAIPEMTEPVLDNKVKTWDEKYEEELEFISKRMREGSGLKDLEDTGLSWGEPPAPNLKNSEGLIVRDV